jgi:hypothetical protein
MRLTLAAGIVLGLVCCSAGAAEASAGAIAADDSAEPAAAVNTTQPAAAVTSAFPGFSFAGFGTFGVVHSSDHNADFTSSSYEPTGAGHTDNWSAAVDSRLGAQLTGNLTAKLSAVLQVVAQQNFDSSYTPHVEWANVQYQITPDFRVRVGRTQLPIFLEADTRLIGYAYPWARPPVEVNNLMPVTSNIGVDVSYRAAFGTLINTVQLTTGYLNAQFPASSGRGDEHVAARRILLLVDTVERGFATVHASYGQARLTVPELGPLFDAFREFGPQGIGVAERYDVDDRHIDFVGASARYDPGEWFAMSEWGRLNGHSVISNRMAWYVSGGYRLGKFTPYVTLAGLSESGNTSDPGIDTAGLPPSLAAAAAELNGALNSILAMRISQRTASIGARWDVVSGASLEAQYDHTQLGTNSQGFLTNLQPGFRLGSSVDLISLTIDFVF